MLSVTRSATHAGSWYTNDGYNLNRELGNWLNAADLVHGPARAIIIPHAGYQYCGSCAAFAYRQISPAVVRKIFILGPSHNVRLDACALSTASVFKTPLNDLHIDKQINKELIQSGLFTYMDIKTDEEEHSIEMTMPYISKVMEGYKNAFSIIPILVGSISSDDEELFGRALAPYLADPQSLFVVSSDFCHWGKRFNYTYYDKSCGAIHESIRNLDHKGMNIIENLNPKSFKDYLKSYGNTICGRHPIAVLLQAVKFLQESKNPPQMSLKFLKYAQSGQCNNMNDSSVSYASASLTFE